MKGNEKDIDIMAQKNWLNNPKNIPLIMILGGSLGLFFLSINAKPLVFITIFTVIMVLLGNIWFNR